MTESHERLAAWTIAAATSRSSSGWSWPFRRTVLCTRARTLVQRELSRFRSSSGLNAGYVGSLLEQYLENPEAVDPAWRELFERGDETVLASLPGLARLVETRADGNGASVAAPPAPAEVQVAAVPVSEPVPAPAPEPAAPSSSVAPGEELAEEAPAPAQVDERAARGRRGGDGARQGLPHARPPERTARSARLRAHGRSRSRRVPPSPAAHTRAPGAHPREAAASLRARRDAARRAPPAARGLHRDDRVRDRAHLGPRRARVAATGDRVGPLPQARSTSRSASSFSSGYLRSKRSRRTSDARSSARSSSRSKASTRSSRCSTRRSSSVRRAERTRS